MYFSNQDVSLMYNLIKFNDQKHSQASAFQPSPFFQQSGLFRLGSHLPFFNPINFSNFFSFPSFTGTLGNMYGMSLNPGSFDLPGNNYSSFTFGQDSYAKLEQEISALAELSFSKPVDLSLNIDTSITDLSSQIPELNKSSDLLNLSKGMPSLRYSNLKNISTGSDVKAAEKFGEDAVNRILFDYRIK